MTIAALTWPDAAVHVAWIAAVGLAVTVLIWSIFRTGRTAIRSESGQRELVERLGREVDELRAQLQQSTPSAELGEREVI